MMTKWKTEERFLFSQMFIEMHFGRRVEEKQKIISKKRRINKD